MATTAPLEVPAFAGPAPGGKKRAERRWRPDTAVAFARRVSGASVSDDEADALDAVLADVVEHAGAASEQPASDIASLAVRRTR